MKLPTGKQMLNIDSLTIKEYSFPSILLMENAGIGITDKILELYSGFANSRIIIFAGPGNNGGDALVINRQLHFRGIASSIILLGDQDKLKGDAKINLDLSLKLNILNFDQNFFCIDTTKKWKEIKQSLVHSDYIIDGIFGTGFEGELKGFFADVINDINNEFKAKVLSVDVPSGLICDDAKQNECIINACTTFTVGLPKLGMHDFPGKEKCGDIHVINIGFPEKLLTSDEIKTGLITIDYAKKIKPQRNANSHKGDYGHLLVVAGNGRYHGAAHFCSMAASAAGAGLVTLASMFTVCNSLKSRTGEIMTVTFEDVLSNEEISLMRDVLDIESNNFSLSDLPKTDSDTFEYICADNFNQIKGMLDNFNSAVIGPGLGTDNSTLEFITEFIYQFEKNIVLDADALNLLSKDMEILNNLDNQERIIITPHIGEFSRLIKKDIHDIKQNKLKYAMDFVKQYNVVLVLKDSVTLIAYKDTVYFNTTGNAGLAKGGSGDVLSGIIGAMLARGLSPVNAAKFGVYLHGLVADLLAELRGYEGVNPEQIIDNIYRGFISI